ncbi:MAG TPA: NAD-dependent dehydratase, partial [Rhizobiales bacterium]|nr:NAD-dependent dehydratase [Hyphomicrobiales bacterium]
VNPIGPRGGYDESKRLGETLTMEFYRQYQLNARIVRIFNTYGPRTHPNDGRVVSNFVVQALLNKDITVFGDGSHTRSFCYVDDLIAGLMKMMDSPSDVTGPINLGNPGEFSILEIARTVLDLTGSRSKIVHRPLPEDDPKQRRPDISEADRVLGWRPTVPFKEGLKTTIAYFEKVVAEGKLERIL